MHYNVKIIQHEHEILGDFYSYECTDDDGNLICQDSIDDYGQGIEVAKEEIISLCRQCI